VVAAGYPEASIARVPHGLPLADYPCRAEQPETGRVIVAVGRLESKKGFDQLLRALALLPEDRRGGLQVVGDGRERARLEALAWKLGLSDEVRFHGRLDPAETRRLMQSAAMLVLPSRRLPNGDRDGIANVLLEAMALGVPVVTTTAGAAGEIIADHRNGILVPADDERSLSEAIGSLLADRPLRERLALAARATVEAQFDLRCTGAALSDVLASHVSVPASNASRQPAP
jgi:glycosyltransferase involved in cell wall biosynthesis